MLSRTGVIAQNLGVLALVVFASGCASTQQEGAAPLRSPSRDYPLPAVTTSNGEVVGADRVPAGEKLETSPAVGSGGPSAAAGTKVPESAEHAAPSPCTEIGLEDASGKTPCRKTTTPTPVAPRGR